MWNEAYTACVQGMMTGRCGIKLTLPVYRGVRTVGCGMKLTLPVYNQTFLGP